MVFESSWIYYLSLISLLILVFSVLKGCKDGFLFKVLDITSTFLALALSFYLGNKFASYFTIIPSDLFSLGMDVQLETFLCTQANAILLSVVVYVMIRLVFLVLFPLLKKVNDVPVIGFFNRLLGSVLGLLHGYIILFILVLLLHSPLVINGNEAIENSILKYVKSSGSYITGFIDEQYTMFSSLQNSEKYEEDPNGNIRVWLDYYEVDASIQNTIIEMMKLRSE